MSQAAKEAYIGTDTMVQIGNGKPSIALRWGRGDVVLAWGWGGWGCIPTVNY